MTERFALQRDDWNDYSFRTFYHLYYRYGDDPANITYIGAVKILKKGQMAGHAQLIQEPFQKLSVDWASVGISLDYYQRLNDIPQVHRQRIMNAINDVVAHPNLIDAFKEEEGWETSLFRDVKDWQGYLNDARTLYQGNFSALADIDLSFTFKPAAAEQEIVFNFSSPEPEFYGGPYRRVGPSKRRTLLPNRVIVLTGRNGAGKSTILSRLAHVAFASPQERATKKLKRLGNLNPPSIGFMRVIAISYSAFDSFVIPGTDAKELSRTMEDLAAGDGRFVFCGLRDLVEEARADVQNDELTKSDDEVSELEVERRTTTRLKPVESLADEFGALITRIRKDEKGELLEAALEPLLADPSFSDLSDQMPRIFKSSRTARSLFLGWSTGHKIALHVVVSLVAHSVARSLILFDEPEAHLHPPLMAALMHSVRIILTEVNAFCVTATHSPVLLQESLAQHTRIVRRVGGSLTITEPNLETFGENVGVLTYHAFGLTAASTDYHKVLDLLVAGCKDLDEVEEAFPNGLSMQGRAYVLSQLGRKA